MCLPANATRKHLEEAHLGMCLSPILCAEPLVFSAVCLFLLSQKGKNLPEYLPGNVLWSLCDLLIPQVYRNSCTSDIEHPILHMKQHLTQKICFGL